VCTLVVGLKHVAALLLCGGAGVQVCWAQNYEFGGTIGYGVYHDGTIFAPDAEIQAGIRNRFAAGVVLGEDLYDYVSGEIRYLYQDGHPFLMGDGVRTDIQGQSHALTYDLLFHFRNRSHKFRPFLAGGLGAKDYVIAGPAPSPQPVPNIAILTTTDEWKFATAVGGGVKFRVQEHVLLRLDFLDYITTFPKQQIMPAPTNTARGIFEQFTPLFGVSYSF
jgi:opacity protein-like surface antigen